MGNFPKEDVEIPFNIIASSVWGYSSKTIDYITSYVRTQIVGEDKSIKDLGYTSSRASKLDYLTFSMDDIPIRVWQYPYRYISGLTGQPRIDLIGQDSSLISLGYTSSRASKLDYLTDALTKMLIAEAPYEGTVTANGSEQTIVERTDNVTFWLEGWIDLSNLNAGDSVVVREYVRIKSGGNYRKYAEKQYLGVQVLPALRVLTLPSRYGIKITIHQTSGTYRSFDYQIHVVKRAQ